MQPIELIAAPVTLAGVYLATRQKVWCWPLGMVSVTLYGVVFYQAKLYANMGLQAVYFALAVYGWWAWLHGGEDHGGLRVSLASGRTRAVLAVAGGVVGVGLGLTFQRFSDASLPLLDSLLSSFSIVAQWMQTRKLLESWLVWLAVDVFYVGMFVYEGLYPTAALYAVFLLLAARGFVAWRRSMVGGGGGEAAAAR